MDMADTMVTVITPAFNRARRVVECVGSVGRQTLPGVEHVVVDDGSTDGTRDRVERTYPDLIRSGRLKILRQDNLGPGAARNAGLAAAEGGFVTYVDSDDLLLDNHVKCLIEPMLSDERIGITYGGHVEQWHDEAGRMIRQAVNPLRQIHAVEFRFKNHIPVMFMHRKSLVERVGGFDTDRLGLEDWDFLMRLTECAGIRWVPAVTSVWRHIPGESSITGRLRGELREEKYRSVIRKAMQRELAGSIRVRELQDDIDALNRTMMAALVDAAQRRAPAPPGSEGRVEDVIFQRVRDSELESLFELVRMHFQLHPMHVDLQILIPRADSPIIEWTAKINRLLAEQGQPRVRLKVQEPVSAL